MAWCTRSALHWVHPLHPLSPKQHELITLPWVNKVYVCGPHFLSALLESDKTWSSSRKPCVTSTAIGPEMSPVSSTLTLEGGLFQPRLPTLVTGASRLLRPPHLATSGHVNFGLLPTKCLVMSANGQRATGRALLQRTQGSHGKSIEPKSERFYWFI